MPILPFISLRAYYCRATLRRDCRHAALRRRRYFERSDAAIADADAADDDAYFAMRFCRRLMPGA